MRRETRPAASEEQVELFSEPPQDAAVTAAVGHAATDRRSARTVSGATHQRHRERQHELIALAAFRAALMVAISAPALTILIGFAVAYLPAYLGIPVMLACTGALGTAVRMLYRVYRDYRDEAWRRARMAARFEMISGAVLMAGSREVRSRIALLLARDREYSERLKVGESTEQLEMRKLSLRQRRGRRAVEPENSPNVAAVPETNSAAVPPDP